MNNFTCRYLSDFTDEALRPLDYIDDELKSIQEYVDGFDTEKDSIRDLSSNISEIINDIQGYIEEIRERF